MGMMCWSRFSYAIPCAHMCQHEISSKKRVSFPWWFFVRVHAPTRWIFDTNMTKRFLRFLVSNHGISPEHIPIPPVYPHFATILVGPILMVFWAFVMPWHVTVVTVGRSLAVLLVKCYIEIHLKHVECWSEDLKMLLNHDENMWMSSKWSWKIMFLFLIFWWQKMVAFCGFFLVGVREEMTSRRDPSATKSWARRCLGRNFFYSPEQRQPVIHPLGFRLLLFVEFRGMKISIVESSVF